MLQHPTVDISELRASCAKLACISTYLILAILYSGSCIQNTSEQFVWCTHLSFVNLASHPTQKKNLRGREERCAPCLNSSILVTISNYTHVQINFFSALRMTDKSPPKILKFLPESPCVMWRWER